MATLSLAERALGAPRVLEVIGRRRETRDTVSLAVAAEGSDYAPGTFNMLYALPVGEVPISVSATAPGAITHTIRDVGLATGALTRLRPGDRVGVRGPFGRGWPLESLVGGDVVVVAGGLGLAPLRPAVHALLASRPRYGRVTLLAGARTPEDLLFQRDLEAWRGRFDLDVEVTVDAAGPAWRGDVGVVTTLFGRLHVDADEAAALVCGPEVMMRFAVAGLLDRGFDAARIWLSLERNMQCGAGLCGHCQLGPFLVCRDGPVLSYAELEPWLRVDQL
jgi:NAD(P)H-flavin reductase